MLLSLVGYHTITGVDRFSFGIPFLYDGIELIPMALGMFGISELLHQITIGNAAIAPKMIIAGYTDILRGIKDVFRHKWLWFRSTLIGYIIGVIPRLGSEVAIWVSYGQAKQTSRNPDEFGTGRVEGVIAPEAANNAKEAGAFLTTMAFGRPGSAVMAIFISAFLIAGITLGPKMMVEKLPLVLTLLLVICLANIITGVICLLTAPHLVKVASVKLDFLFPSIIVLILGGIYSVTLSPLNFVVALAFGFLGLAMRWFGYSRPALLLGFVLGGMLEHYSLLSVKIYGPLFFFRPIPLVLIGITILVVSYPSLKTLLSRFTRRSSTS